VKARWTDEIVNDLRKHAKYAEGSLDRAGIAEYASRLVGVPVTWNAVNAAVRRFGGWYEEHHPDVRLKIPAGVVPGGVTKGDALQPVQPYAQDGFVGHVLVVPDVHVRIMDRRSWDAMFALLRDLPTKRTVVVVLGDFLDLTAISSHDNIARDVFGGGYRVVEEVEQARILLQALASEARCVYYLEGNHENRVRRLVDAMPGLWGHPAFEPRSFFQLPDRVHFIDEVHELRIGASTYQHGHALFPRGGPKTPARNALSKLGLQNVKFGHTHKWDYASHQVYNDRGRPEAFEAWNLGHLTRTDQHGHYAPLPEWAHGFAVEDHWYDTVAERHRFTTHPVRVVGHAFSFGGRVYDGKGTQ